jgi:hypothetical protein
VSPGFEHKVHAHRAIVPGCLFCHTNGARPVAGSVNHYETPIFQGYPIGCERCHGPGALHVERRKLHPKVEGLDDTIVNPRRLEPALREAVCQQCHLPGEVRVQRAGRGTFDYRPGLPIELFLSIFVKPPEEAADYKSVSQVEQMYSSKCFRESAGRFGCTSCHDPHRRPEREERVRYYRKRCQACHENGHKPCREPLEARRQKDNSCVACHMPTAGSTNIAHTAVTDHRLLKDPAKAGSKRSAPPDELRLLHFHSAIAGRTAPSGLQRDLAVALTQLAGGLPPGPPQARAARRVLSLLDEAGRISPRDADGWQARATALYVTGQGGKALEVVQALVERLPQAEEALLLAARWTAALDRRQDSRRYWERLIAVNPWTPQYRVEFAQLLVEERDWRGAAGQCEAALRTDAGDAEARLLLVSCLLKAGKKDAARQEWKKLQALRPTQDRRYRSLARLLGDG